MKILVNTPDINLLGGVANHYKGLKNYWSEDVRYNYVGGRKGIPGPICLVYDYLKFVFYCAFGNYDAILLNPSLGKTAVKRDKLFLRIAKLFSLKTIVFFHGWEESLANEIDKNPLRFSKTFGKADGLIVLASIFKQRLISWGINAPIFLSTTKIDDTLIKNFDLNKKRPPQTVLFLARIEENKGILTTIEAVKQVHFKYPGCRLNIAGDGSALLKAKKYVRDHHIENVTFLGNLKDKALAQAFENASIYILPTSHGEGMPTSLLESMAFGLPIISRPVGGTTDFFEEGKMGFLLESLSPEDYARKIMDLLSDPERINSIGKYNHIYACEHFLASKVATNLEGLIREIVTK